MKVLKITLYAIFIGVVSFVLINFYYASQSYRIACFGDVEEEINNGNVVGMVNNTNNNITIFVDKTNPEYERILKHESCHVKFREKNIPVLCIPPTLLVEEFICYVGEYF